MKQKILDFYILRSYYWRKVKERFLMWLVWKLPSDVIMWSALRLVAYATTGKYGTTIVPELTAMDALKRWGDDRD